MFTKPNAALSPKPRQVELEAMKQRLSGAKMNKPMKKPMMRSKTTMNFSGVK